MRPVLIEFGGIGIPAYGVMLAVSFLAALWYVKRKAPKFDISGVIIENLAFYIMLGVVIGGRLLYVAFHWEQYQNDFIGIFRIWEGGMMFFGGFLGGFLLGALYMRRQRIPISKIADLVAPSLGLGLFFTRIGCFFNGCCFGEPSALPWAVRFPPECVAGASPIGTQALHPTQLYESVFGLALFFFLNNRLGRSERKGAVFAQFLIFYGVFRFGIDLIRYYENSANYWINQVIALGLIIAGIVMLVRPVKKPS
ncbi:MAG: prolipoprotein diacylglyceryl transferase [candidate division WOR-3 bacterium]|nr:MAG: prolipoprotein diacylglyceryl transferase [candidate division WOR-3 bacterium]